LNNPYRHLIGYAFPRPKRLHNTATMNNVRMPIPTGFNSA
jgi:hypothetical protein